MYTCPLEWSASLTEAESKLASELEEQKSCDGSQLTNHSLAQYHFTHDSKLSQCICIHFTFFFLVLKVARTLETSVALHTHVLYSDESESVTLM